MTLTTLKKLARDQRLRRAPHRQRHRDIGPWPDCVRDNPRDPGRTGMPGGSAVSLLDIDPFALIVTLAIAYVIGDALVWTKRSNRK